MNIRVRKYKSLNINCQKLKLKKQLIELFKKNLKLESRFIRDGLYIKQNTYIGSCICIKSFEK